jgi:hypothetical protein
MSGKTTNPYQLTALNVIKQLFNIADSSIMTHKKKRKIYFIYFSLFL